MLLSLYLLQLFVLRSLYNSEERLKTSSEQHPQKLIRLMQASNTYKRWSLVLLCLLSVLCVHISYVLAEEASAEICLEYFTEIIEIQKMREMLQHGANEMILRHERGNLKKKELDATLHIWYITESELRTRVTRLYDIAYKQKCFDEELNESRRLREGDASKI